jgi:hypothetical protein
MTVQAISTRRLNNLQLCSNKQSSSASKVSFFNYTQNNTYGIDPADVLDDKGLVEINSNNPAGALNYYQRALQIRQNTYGNDSVYYNKLAKSYTNIGSAYYLLKNYSSALTCHREALNNYLRAQEARSYQLSQQTREDSLDVLPVEQCYRRIGVVLREMGATTNAIQQLVIAKEKIVQIAQNNSSNKDVEIELGTVLFDLSKAYYNYGSSNTNYLKEAENLATEALNHYRYAGLDSSDPRLVAAQAASDAYRYHSYSSIY